MKKETFTTEILNLAKMAKSSMVMITFAFLSFGINQIHAQICPLACDDLVQVSLDEKCHAEITPDMMLEGAGTDPNCNYYVVVKGTNGLPLPYPYVNSTHIGKTLEVGVFSGSNSCWGHIYVEDKLPPVIICPENDTFYCNQTKYVLKQPYVYDACSNVTRVLVSDVLEKYPCDAQLAGKRTISYYYIDESGNKSETCHQCVYFRKPDYGKIDWPKDIIYTCFQFDTVPLPSVSGVPTLGGEPLYPDWSICKLGVTFEDQIIYVCTGTFKVIRKWTIVDWCLPSGQNITTYFQIIKVVDEIKPEIYCSPDMTISTDIQSCTGTAIIPPPTLIKECSRVTFKVGHKVYTSIEDTTFEGTSDANVSYKNGFYTISKLPLGLNCVVFQVIDECGNIAECHIKVKVEDQVPPIAVCDQKTTVSLTIDGTAKIYAETFDDGSHDNCQLAGFEVKRMDNGVPCKTRGGDYWNPSVSFCCDDMGKTIMVALRVWDKGGNSNTCMVEVEVQDKLAPTIVCPPCISISCEYDYPDLSVFGTVRDSIKDRKPIIIKDTIAKFCTPSPLDGYAYDGCGVTVAEFSTNNLICGKGTITRRFEATDAKGLKSTCYQTITIIDTIKDNVIVEFPKDYYNNTTCMSIQDLTPSVTGKPKIKGANKCSNIATSYSDLTFTFEPDACIKIIRTWTVIDWCIYNPNNSNGAGYWTWKQVIKLLNLVPPTITNNCANHSVDVVGPGCKGFVSLVGTATDDCTDPADLVWWHEIDLNNDGRLDSAHIGPGNDASAVLPVGFHKVCFRVKDLCGNESRCCYILNVRDAKKPTPYCLSGITTVVMPSTKNIEIWAKDFNVNSEDNCTDKSKLRFFFFVNGTFYSSLAFDCSHIGKNIIRVYVMDEAGNFDYCETVLEIQDPNHVCPTGLTIQGKITTPDNRSVKNVTVALERISPAGYNQSYTDDNGTFSFSNVSTGLNYEIKAEKNFDAGNGVSTQDIVLIQKHILGQQTFNSPYQYIAADANNSTTITAADLAEIRKLILGKITQYNSNSSWRFVPKNFVFPNAANPFPFEEKISFNGINRNEMTSNMFAVKVGDISGNVDVTLAQKTNTRTADRFEMYIPQIEVVVGNEVRVPIYSDQAQILSGMQFGMQFNSEALEYMGIECAAIECSDEQMAISNNVIKMSYVADQDLSISKDQKLFTLVFKAKKKVSYTNLIKLNSVALQGEAYNQIAEVMEVRLTTRSKENKDKGSVLNYKLFQNQPNPFSETATIGFEIPKSQTISFVIYDVDGKTIQKIEKAFEVGYHEISVSKQQLVKPGVYFIQMNSGEFTETKKMVLIH